MNNTMDISKIPIPTMEHLAALVGDYMDSESLEALDGDLWISAPYEALIYGVREVAKGKDFLHSPIASYLRFFILVERSSQETEHTLSIVGFMDFKYLEGRIVPVHWQRGEPVRKLLFAASVVDPDNLNRYTLRFVEVDPLHFNAVWFLPVPGVGTDELLIPIRDELDSDAVAEFSIETVTESLVSLARQREEREEDYYKKVAEITGTALKKLQPYEEGPKP